MSNTLGESVLAENITLEALEGLINAIAENITVKRNPLGSEIMSFALFQKMNSLFNLHRPYGLRIYLSHRPLSFELIFSKDCVHVEYWRYRRYTRGIDTTPDETVSWTEIFKLFFIDPIGAEIMPKIDHEINEMIKDIKLGKHELERYEKFLPLLTIHGV